MLHFEVAQKGPSACTFLTGVRACKCTRVRTRVATAFSLGTGTPSNTCCWPFAPPPQG